MALEQDHEGTREHRTESGISCIPLGYQSVRQLFSAHYYSGIIQHPRALVRKKIYLPSKTWWKPMSRIHHLTKKSRHRCCLSMAVGMVKKEVKQHRGSIPCSPLQQHHGLPCQAPPLWSIGKAPHSHHSKRQPCELLGLEHTLSHPGSWWRSPPTGQEMIMRSRKQPVPVLQKDQLNTKVFFFKPMPSPFARQVKIFTHRISTGRSLPEGSFWNWRRVKSILAMPGFWKWVSVHSLRYHFMVTYQCNAVRSRVCDGYSLYKTICCRPGTIINMTFMIVIINISPSVTNILRDINRVISPVLSVVDWRLSKTGVWQQISR